MLNPRQRQYLKAQAHHFKPVMHIGKSGVTDGLIQELDQMLESLELIKIKLNKNTFEDLQTVSDVLTRRIEGLQEVWTIGHTLLIYRASRNNPTKYPLP